jgi:hypothetical protein
MRRIVLAHVCRARNFVPSNTNPWPASKRCAIGGFTPSRYENALSSHAYALRRRALIFS